MFLSLDGVELLLPLSSFLASLLTWFTKLFMKTPPPPLESILSLHPFSSQPGINRSAIFHISSFLLSFPFLYFLRSEQKDRDPFFLSEGPSRPSLIFRKECSLIISFLLENLYSLILLFFFSLSLSPAYHKFPRVRKN